MRSPMFASFVLLAATIAVPANAQRLETGRMIAPQIGVPQVNGPQLQGAPYGVPQINAPQINGPQFNGPRLNGPQLPPRQAQLRGPRQQWGGQVGGRWIGGVRAPGGWNAYRRPGRGFRLPGYWVSPGFYIGNFGAYGLSTPPYGYNWSRYYDDAVLIDRRGRVRDWVGGVDWNGYSDGYDVGFANDISGYDAPGAGYQGTYEGTYQVDGRTGYQQGYQTGRYGAPVVQQHGPIIQQGYPHGYTQTWTAGSGYWYPGGVTTIITVQSAPVITTTTTTEYVETVRYRPVRHVYRKPARIVKTKLIKGCRC